MAKQIEISKKVVYLISQCLESNIKKSTVILQKIIEQHDGSYVDNEKSVKMTIKATLDKIAEIIKTKKVKDIKLDVFLNDQCFYLMIPDVEVEGGGDEGAAAAGGREGAGGRPRKRLRLISFAVISMQYK